MTKKELRNRIKRIISTSLFLILSTYLWFSFSPLRSKALDNTYFSQAFLQIEEVGNSVLLEDVYPQLDEYGLENEGYTFKIINNNNKSVKYKLSFVADSNNTLDNKYIRYSYNVNGGEYSVPQNLSDEGILVIDSIGNSSENTYNLKFWIDYNAGNEIMNKSFNARIGVQAI
ncbi:MAG: hypothetical protein ACI4OT_03340 [Bacilli bacterium]